MEKFNPNMISQAPESHATLRQELLRLLFTALWVRLADP